MYRSKKKKIRKSTDNKSVENDNQTAVNTETIDRNNMHNAESSNTIQVLFGVVAVSFLSIPICYILSYMKQMKDSLNVFLYAAVICSSVIPLTYFLLIKHLIHVRRDTYFYVFTIFAFTAMADLLLALTIDDYSSAFHFYLEQGEVYLKTAHGLFINYWDGTTHYALYLIMLYYMLEKQTENKFFRFLSLFWCGSIINSLIVLLGGAAVGIYGSHIKPSYMLNVPYTVFPIVFLVQQLNSRSSFIHKQKRKERKAATIKSIFLRPLDMIFIFYMIFATAFAIYRVLHALKVPMMNNSVYYQYEPYLLNQSGFPLIQLLTYAFYFIPYYCSAINALLFHGQSPSKFEWFPDWTMIHAGAAAQAQFSYFMSSLHNPAQFPDSSWSKIPSEHLFISSSLNILLALVPQLLALRVCMQNRDFDFY